MNGVTQITVTEDVSLITFYKVPNDLKTISRIFAAVADAGVNIDMISQTTPQSGFVSFSFTVYSGDAVKVIALANSMKSHADGIKPMVSTGNCKIQLYGEEMPQMTGVYAQVLGALSKSGADVGLITTSEVDISLLVTAAHIGDVVTALEQEFSVSAQS